MSEFPPQLPHGELQEIFPDVFFVTGQSRYAYGERVAKFSRNMIVVRDGRSLTLVNTLRLDDDGIARLETLGKIEHIVKLGAFHGRDDAFYLEQSGATMWSFKDMPHERGVKSDAELVPGQAGPFKGADSFVFETAAVAEGLLLLRSHGGVLMSCDSLQNYAEPDEYWDDSTAALMRPEGFRRGATVGPGFLNKGNPKAIDFARLKKLEFCHLLSAHGPPLLQEARTELTATVERTFPG